MPKNSPKIRITVACQEPPDVAVVDLTKREAYLATSRMRSPRHTSVVTDFDMHQMASRMGASRFPGHRLFDFS